MINKIQKVINRAIYSNKSFSQEGEDIILSRLFNDKKNGFLLMLVHIIHFVFLTPLNSTRKVGVELT